MSELIVEHVSHGFGGRKILEDASFRLQKGEHVGLVGANGEGKSTFLNIITGQLMPDMGNITWGKRTTVGYLDQHSSLKAGTTIREVLREAFGHYYDLEKEMMKLYVLPKDFVPKLCLTKPVLRLILIIMMKMAQNTKYGLKM